MAEQKLTELRNIRLEKVRKLRELGIDPYPAKLKRDPQKISNSRLMEGQEVCNAGRIMGFRSHGNIAFADLRDESGNIQVFFQKKNLEERFKIAQLLDIGDFLLVEGKVFKTQAGEITIDVNDFQILTKTINPLPSVWHGLKDVEDRYRKRYLDLILNPEVSERLKKRSKVIDSIRDFLTDNGFLEVETPTLQPIYGGGFARPFKTHHNALDSDFYLRISDEMYLKRLIVGGFEKVFEITKVFRNEGVDFDHNPEFTMFEAQIAYKDYLYGMDLIEEIIEYAANRVNGTTEVMYQDLLLNFQRPWKRYKVIEAIKEFTGVDPLAWSTLEGAKEAAKKLPIKEEKLSELSKMRTIGEVIAFVFEELVEEKLMQPTIIYDYPIEVSPLAKKCDDPRFTQRFEYFAFGTELGNNYTELNDPVDLKQRFVEEKEREKAGFDEAHQTDNDYLNAIEHGFPPTCGLSIGIDRLVILLTNAQNIREVIPFPTLRPIGEKAFHSQKKASINEKDAQAVLDPNVKDTFDGISYAWVLIKNVDIKKSDKELEKRKKEILAQQPQISQKELREIPFIKAYREMIKETGVDPSSHLPSPEALLKRVVSGKGIYNINTAVDAYNLAVLETHIGLGGFDAVFIEFPVTLRFSKKGEEMKLLGDNGEITKTKEGELVYADAEKLLTLDLNYRDIEETKITEKTKDIILFADGGRGISQEDVLSALKKGAEYIQEFSGGEIGAYKIVE